MPLRPSRPFRDAEVDQLRVDIERSTRRANAITIAVILAVIVAGAIALIGRVI